MESINLKEARRRLSEIIDAAERGEATVITRRGKRVARIVPLEPKRRKKFPDLSAFRATIKMKGKSLSQTLIDMRKEERY